MISAAGESLRVSNVPPKHAEISCIHSAGIDLDRGAPHDQQHDDRDSTVFGSSIFFLFLLVRLWPCPSHGISRRQNARDRAYLQVLGALSAVLPFSPSFFLSL